MQLAVMSEMFAHKFILLFVLAIVSPFALAWNVRLHNEFLACRFVRDLQYFGDVKYLTDEMANLVCLAFYASNYTITTKKSLHNKVTDYGIFQISDHFWCRHNDEFRPVLNHCNVDCDNLASKNYQVAISSSVKCVRNIVANGGFSNFFTYEIFCQRAGVMDHFTKLLKSCHRVVGNIKELTTEKDFQHGLWHHWIGDESWKNADYDAWYDNRSLPERFNYKKYLDL